MAIVEGTIRSAGVGVSGLRVVAYEEVREGAQLDDDKPCRLTHPDVLQVGDTVSDSAGRFTIPFQSRSKSPLACAFTASVRITVLDGNTLVWHSPKRAITPVVTFDRDLFPTPEPQPSPSATIRGALTLCGQPAEGYQVLAFEVLKIGVPTTFKPCLVLSPQQRLIGAAVVDSQGNFSINYSPSAHPPGACSFDAQVRVDVFDVTVPVWNSPLKPLGSEVRFDHELYPDCEVGSRLIRVVTDLGLRAQGAEVFVNGEFRGETDTVGQLFVEGLKVGDSIAARRRLHENATKRKAHDVDSDKNWNYRVYLTSITLLHDENGNQPFFEQFIVSNLFDTQELVIRRRNALIGFNIVVSVEWEATASELLYYRDRFLEASELIYNATDGQFLIERLHILDRAALWDEADARIYANWNQASDAKLGGIAGSKGRIRFGPYDAQFPGNILHEFGHYAFFLEDEYKPAACWPESRPDVFCTLKSDVDGTEFSSGASKDSCPMRGAQYGSRKKFCSSHPDNPHVDCTAQGPEDCWSVIVERYGGLPEWRLWTPVSRGALVDLLPDTGIPISSTMPPNDADQAGSYIPVAAWKPRWHVTRHPRDGECGELLVRIVVANGPIISPVNGVLVWLRTPDGRLTLEGRTKDKDIPDTKDGEIVLRGVHLGDAIEYSLPFSPSVQGTATIQSCTSPLVVSVPAVVAPAPIRMRSLPVGMDRIHVDVETSNGAMPSPPIISTIIDGEHEPSILEPERIAVGGGHRAFISTGVSDEDREFVVTVFGTDSGRIVVRNSVATRKLYTSDETTVTSAGGEVALTIPRNALRIPAQVVIEEALGVAPPVIDDRSSILVNPHRITSSHGDTLQALALLHMNLGDGSSTRRANRAYRDRIELVEYVEEAGEWRALAASVHTEPLAATASIRRLGTFALVQRKA